MKIIYLINSLKNPGGMERVLINKANYLVREFNYNIIIITTDQDKKEIFYPLDSKVTLIDLDINYFKDNDLDFSMRSFNYLKKQNIHKNKIEKILFELDSDYTVSLGCEDRYFLTKIKDSSKKIRELHFCKEYRKIYMKCFNKSIIYKIKAYLDIKYEEYINNKFYKVVTLTKEDRKNWNNKNMITIPNCLPFMSEKKSKIINKKIISVGRLDAQKGYDLLIKAWAKLENDFKNWSVEIYGDGKDKEDLKRLIEDLNLKRIKLSGTTKNIKEKYLESSLYVMSSRFEGFGMVLIEAMECGLPVVSFACPTGPKDIINNSKNGLLVKNGSISDLSVKIKYLIENPLNMKLMGERAKIDVQKFSEKKIMKKWKELFEGGLLIKC